MDLELTTDDVQEIVVLFEQASSQLDENQMVELKDKVASAIRSDVERRFLTAPLTNSGGTVYGNAFWKPVSDKYLKQRPDRLYMPLLQDTGQLRDSLIYEDANGHMVEYTPTGVSIGSNIVYAHKQHTDRPVLFFHDELTNEITSIIAAEII